MLGFVFSLLLRVALETAMVFLELICQNPGKAMDPISLASDKRP